MLKVLIADDEEKVCQLIFHLVDWAALGLEIAAIVNDGKKAYEFICNMKPDIVITDIRMPNYDGIELIKMTKEILPDTYFIIISGYSQFEYAKSAIQYGVENYLLKPIKKKELVSTLSKIVEKNNLLLSDHSEKDELKQMLKTSAEKVKRNLLAEFFLDFESKLTNQSLEEINRDFCSHFMEGYFTLLIIKPFLDKDELNRETLSLLLTKLLLMTKEKLEVCCIETIAIIWEDQVVCLINTKDATLTDVKKQLNKMKVEISNLKDIIQNARAIVGIGNVTEKLADLNTIMHQAEVAVMNRFGKPGQYIIQYKDTYASEHTVPAMIDNNMRSRFLSYFEVLDVDNIMNEITTIQNTLVGQCDDCQLIYQCYNELIDIILFGAKNYMNQWELPENTWFRKKFKMFLTIDDIFEWLKHYLREELDKYINNKKVQDSKPIRQAKQYINENYNSDINLEGVSSMIGFNPAYFSSLFKKETGENFMEYVMKVRIQNAKNLLIQTDKDISEIAEDVGYTDLKYFSKLFKKRTGLSPLEFRKLYG